MISVLSKNVSAGVDARVHSEKVRQLFRQNPAAIAASSMIAALMLSVIYSHESAAALLWASVFVAVQSARAALVVLHRQKRELATDATWERLFCVMTFFSGCAWGLAAVWLFPHAPLAYQFFICLVCMGLGAGAASSLASITAAYLLFLLPAMLPAAVLLLFERSDLAHITGACALVYVGGMIVVATANQRLLSSSLRLQFVNLELAEELQALATRDSLTGLPNRLILAERLGTALRRAARSAHDVAIVFVDCDDFKAINDTYGHAAGDEYLQGVARALESAVREVDTVARLGGDEFIVLLERCGDRETVHRIVDRLRTRVSQPLAIAGQTIVPHLSVGVSSYPGDGTDGETLIRQADEAMYAAKRAGGNTARFYEAGNVGAGLALQSRNEKFSAREKSNPMYR